MAQTRRMGKLNQTAHRPKSAEVFVPNYVPFLAGLAFLLLKLTRMGAVGQSREAAATLR